MIDPRLSPTRLVRPDERAPIPVVDPVSPSRWQGVRVLALVIGWFAGGAWLRLRRRLTPEENARRFKRLLVRLGGLWIMAGQLLSLRVDLFSAVLCRELSSLQMHGTALPFEVARQVLEAELGRPFEEVFSEFDRAPFAATWVCQIHRARLREEGEWVAVKIQRPFLQGMFARDLKWLAWLARWFGRLSARPSIHWDVGLWELRQIVEQETDFRFEASAITRMGKNLPNRRVAVPHLFERYCTSRLLVTQFIHAALMSDYIRMAREDPDRLRRWLIENDIDPRLVARRLFNSFLRQLFEDNFYHGDLYPGNIVLLRENRLALLHFGSCGFTDREYLQKIRLFFRTLAARDYAKAADLMLMLCAQLPDIDTDRVKDDVIRTLRAWTARTYVRELPYDVKSIDNATVEVMRTLFSYGCSLDWGFLRIRRAMAILDASLAHLFPDVNYSELSDAYFRRAERRAFARFASRLPARMATSTMRAAEIQDRIGEFTMFYGSILRRNAQVFQGTTDRFSYLVAAGLGQLALVLLVIGGLMALALAGHWWPDLAALLVGPQVARVIARLPMLDTRVWVAFLALDAFLLVRLRRLRNRFLQRDAGRNEGQ